jgi:hypothetical protein
VIKKVKYEIALIKTLLKLNPPKSEKSNEK